MSETASVQDMRVDAAVMADYCRAVLGAIGADEATVDAATRAMVHGSLHGVDSHGVRLLPHYVRVMREGRVNRQPQLNFVRNFGAIATLDADHAHGACAAYAAMDEAVSKSRQFGMGAVAIQNSSHFGAAGCYALAAAEAGCIGLVFCNSDSFVRLHDGAERLHGTNPIAMAAPVKGGKPWLLDMATSVIPYNRVQLYRSLGVGLPEGVASDKAGADTRDPEVADMLAPLGGAFGFKGAGLAGMAEIFSALLTGMKMSFEILPMAGPDLKTPRELGAFVMALEPKAFGGAEDFEADMARYVAALQASRSRPDTKVMVPGDREWRVAAEREQSGIHLDPVTRAECDALSAELAIAPLRIKTG